MVKIVQQLHQPIFAHDVGKPANFIVLNGANDVEVIREQADVLYSVCRGKMIVERQPAELKTSVELGEVLEQPIRDRWD
ncbi:hypothetical protein ACPUEK_15075 [Marinomonas gallaica]|uniref:hypothetical protein n=1 Tax=Marinomonas gallaica TaxID=1806667 RepID=UPI003CE52580